MAAVRETVTSWQTLERECIGRWYGVVAETNHERRMVLIMVPHDVLRQICLWLSGEVGLSFVTLIAAEESDRWHLTYVFLDTKDRGWVRVEYTQPLELMVVPSISDEIHAADWHEREVEDLFGLSFEGHPKLGDFVLHEDWPEGMNPMRKHYQGRHMPHLKERSVSWQPRTIVEAPGAFAMPIGPVYSDFAESAHFTIETTGEDMIRVLPRFFYKYRGVEKLAEGRSAEDALLLAERFSGDSAFAHGWAYCRAVEAIAGITVPHRAEALRTVFAELERLRQHIAVITGLCGSTGLWVSQAQSALLEEELLRLTCDVCGHRYLFGVLRLGGLARDVGDLELRELSDDLSLLRTRIERLQADLRFSSSFLDRIEEVGFISHKVVKAFGLVGPVARASGGDTDVRKLFRYGIYERLKFEVPVEEEGDGYARLRVLFREAFQSIDIIDQVMNTLPPGGVCRPFKPKAGVELGYTEAPLGATFHWVRLREDGKVERYRIATPSYRNWHAFRVAVEHYSFQDFPIILATFGLSQAESDR